MSKNSPQHRQALMSGKQRPPQVSQSDNPRKLPKPITAEETAWVKSMIVYEDEYIMGFNKPSGLSSQGGRGGGHNLDDMMWAFAKSNGKRPNLIHRLDRDTSGILLVAKTHPATSYLGKALMRRAFDKTYLAVVGNAHNLADRCVVEAPLRREEVGRESWSRVCEPDHVDAQAAKTTFEVLSRRDDAALVRCTPHTGRMHQIRVHLAHLGAPIAGDVRYGGALSLGGERVGRLMLHALRLTFPHPSGPHPSGPHPSGPHLSDKGEMTLNAPLAVDIVDLCAAIELDVPPDA